MSFYALFLIFVGGCVVAASSAMSGLVIWIFFDMMNPHQQVYGGKFQFSMIIGAITIGGWLLSKKEEKNPATRQFSILVVLMIILVIISEINSLSPFTYRITEMAVKLLICILVASLLVNTRVRLHTIVLINIIALGFYTVKGGVFGIMTGGNLQDLGPSNSMITDNNHIALAINTILPMAFFMFQYSVKRIMRIAMLAILILGVLTVLLTFSRGGFIALTVLAIYAFFRSRQRFALVGAAIVVVSLATYILPPEWFARVETLQQGEGVSTLQTRIAGWENAWNVAVNNPVTGGGLRAFYSRDISLQYWDGYQIAQIQEFQGWAGHSIYFEMLGGLGFPGLALFLYIFYHAWAQCSKASRLAKKRDDMKWACDLSNMLRASLVAYAVGGAAVSMEWWIGLWLLLMMMANLPSIVKHEIEFADGVPAKKKAVFQQPQPAHSAQPAHA